MKKLIQIIITTLMFNSVVYADLYEDQFNTLQGQYNNAIKEYNRKYATALQPMLDKARKDGNVPLYNKIRQTLFDIGHPIDEDWYIGRWEIEDNDGGKVTRIYEFFTNNIVKYHGRTDNGTGSVASGTVGSYQILPDGTLKVSFNPAITMIITKKGNQLNSLRWKQPDDFPHAAKAVQATSIKKL